MENNKCYEVRMEPLHGNVKWKRVENTLPQKVKHWIIYDPTIPITRHIHQKIWKTGTWTDTQRPKFIEALFIIAKRSVCQSIEKWMGKQHVIHPWDGILFSHSKEWSYDTCYTVMKLKILTLGGNKSYTKVSYCMISLTWSRSTHRDRE